MQEIFACGIRNPESGKFLLMESEILGFDPVGFGIRNTAQEKPFDELIGAQRPKE